MAFTTRMKMRCCHLRDNSDIEVTLRQFEFALLDEMGLLPDFTTDVEYELCT